MGTLRDNLPHAQDIIPFDDACEPAPCVPSYAELRTIILVHGKCLNRSDLHLQFRLFPNEFDWTVDRVPLLSEHALKDWRLAYLLKPKVSSNLSMAGWVLLDMMKAQTHYCCCRTAWPCGCLLMSAQMRNFLELLTSVWNFGAAWCSWALTSCPLRGSGRR